MFVKECGPQIQGWLRTSLCEQRTTVRRIWPENTTKRSPNANANKRTRRSLFNEQRTQRSLSQSNKTANKTATAKQAVQLVTLDI